MTERKLEYVRIIAEKAYMSGPAKLEDPTRVKIRTFSHYEGDHEVEMLSMHLRVGSDDEIKIEVHKRDDG